MSKRSVYKKLFSPEETNLKSEVSELYELSSKKNLGSLYKKALNLYASLPPTSNYETAESLADILITRLEEEKVLKEVQTRLQEQINQNKLDLDKVSKRVQKEIIRSKKTLKDLENWVNDVNNIQSVIKKELNEFKKQADDLGINPMSVMEYKDATNSLESLDDMKKFAPKRISILKEAIKKI